MTNIKILSISKSYRLIQFKFNLYLKITTIFNFIIKFIIQIYSSFCIKSPLIKSTYLLSHFNYYGFILNYFHTYSINQFNKLKIVLFPKTNQIFYLINSNFKSFILKSFITNLLNNINQLSL